MSSDILSTQASTHSGSSSSSKVDTSFGSTSATVAKQQTQDVKPTPVGSLSTDFSTETSKHGVLQPSFDIGGSDSSQFAMQHATQALPGNSVSLATISYTSEASQIDQNTESSSKTMDVGKTGSSVDSDKLDTSVVFSSSVPESVHLSKSVLGGVVASKDLQNNSVEHLKHADSPSSKYEPVVSETVSATVSQSAGQTVSVSLTQSVSVSLESLGSSAKSPVSPPDYVAASRDLFHTMTPSKTEFSSSVLDTMSLKTTPIASLTPSVKPVTTDSGDSTPLFGGKVRDLGF